MIHRYSFLKMAVVAAGLLAAGRAAADYKEYPGLVCQPAPGSGGSYALHFGTVFNNSSTSELRVVCPLVADASYIGGGGVYLWQRNSNVPFTCTLHDEFVSGSSVFGSDETKSTQTSSSSFQSLSMTPANAGIYYWLECTIPRSRFATSGFSHLISIGINES